MRILFFFITLVILIYTSFSAKIIIIHGSFAHHEKWHRPGGDFYEAIRTIGAPQHQQVETFLWSGIPLHTQLYKAAQELTYYLLSLTDTQPLILIGHSHGGNVINLSSQLIFDYFWDNVYTTTINSDAPIITTVPHPFSFFDLTYTTRKKAWVLSERPKDLFFIDCAILLGTPVNTTHYYPHMQTIVKLVQLYSLGDAIQAVGGFYDRIYPLQDRICNILLTIQDSERRTDPSHSQLHAPIIAQQCIKKLITKDAILSSSMILYT